MIVIYQHSVAFICEYDILNFDVFIVGFATKKAVLVVCVQLDKICKAVYVCTS